MSSAPRVRSAWFLPRTRDQPFLEAMSLGDIILSPYYPDETINGEPPPAVPTGALRRREEAPWSWTREFEHSRSGGLFATFLQLVGVGGEVEASSAHSHTDLYDAERLVTEEFTPDRQYLEKLLEDEDVRDVLTGPARKPKVYMVTGLKLAYGATKATRIMRSNAQRGRIGVDVSSSGVPLTVGLKGGLSDKSEETLAAGKSDFVFGFKLRRLMYRRGKLSHTVHDRGAQFGISPEGLDEDGGGLSGHPVESIDPDELEDEEVEGADVGMQRRTVTVDDNEQVDYLFPQDV